MLPLLALCCLFIRSKLSYIDEPTFYFYLGDWFGFSRDNINLNQYPNWSAPDICCSCLSDFGRKTIGGRLRDSCFNCFPNENEKIFSTWCLPNLAQGLGINKELLEAHIAEAIKICKNST